MHATKKPGACRAFLLVVTGISAGFYLAPEYRAGLEATDLYSNVSRVYASGLLPRGRMHTTSKPGDLFGDWSSGSLAIRHQHPRAKFRGHFSLSIRGDALVSSRGKN